MEGFPIGGGGWAAELAAGWGCCHGGRLPVAGVEVVVVSVTKDKKKNTNTIEHSKIESCVELIECHTL